MKRITFVLMMVLVAGIVVCPIFLNAAGGPKIRVTVNPSSISFGTIGQGSTQNKDFTVEQSSPQTVTCTCSANPATVFQIQQPTKPVPKRTPVAFTLTVVAPNSAGTVTGTMTVTCEDSSVTVPLQAEVASLQPDLGFIGGRFQASKETTTGGNVVTVTIPIINVGVSGSQPCRLTVKLDQAVVTVFVSGFDDLNIPALDPLGQLNNQILRTLKFATDAAPGNHTVEVTLDSDNRNVETHEDNNTTSQILSI